MHGESLMNHLMAIICKDNEIDLETEHEMDKWYSKRKMRIGFIPEYSNSYLSKLCLCVSQKNNLTNLLQVNNGVLFL